MIDDIDHNSTCGRVPTDEPPAENNPLQYSITPTNCQDWADRYPSDLVIPRLKMACPVWTALDGMKDNKNYRLAAGDVPGARRFTQGPRRGREVTRIKRGGGFVSSRPANTTEHYRRLMWSAFISPAPIRHNISATFETQIRWVDLLSQLGFCTV